MSLILVFAFLAFVALLACAWWALRRPPARRARHDPQDALDAADVALAGVSLAALALDEDDAPGPGSFGGGRSGGGGGSGPF